MIITQLSIKIHSFHFSYEIYYHQTGFVLELKYLAGRHHI